MTFTIDSENSISGFATPEEAAAASRTPFDTFGSQPEFAELAAQWRPSGWCPSGTLCLEWSR